MDTEKKLMLVNMTGHCVRRSICRRPDHQGAEGAPQGQEEGQEHQAQRRHLHGRHHRRCQDHEAEVHGQGVLRGDEGDPRNGAVRGLHRRRGGPPRHHRRDQRR